MARQSRNRVLAFDFDEALAFEGDTGPYLQYSAVRAAKIFDKLEDRRGEGRFWPPRKSPSSAGARFDDDLWELVLRLRPPARRRVAGDRQSGVLPARPARAQPRPALSQAVPRSPGGAGGRRGPPRVCGARSSPSSPTRCSPCSRICSESRFPDEM